MNSALCTSISSSTPVPRYAGSTLLRSPTAMNSAGISARNGASWYWSIWRAEKPSPPHDHPGRGHHGVAVARVEQPAVLVFRFGEPVLLATVDVVVAVHLVDVHRVAQRLHRLDLGGGGRAHRTRCSCDLRTRRRRSRRGWRARGRWWPRCRAAEHRCTLRRRPALAQMLLDPLLGVALVRRAADPVLGAAPRAVRRAGGRRSPIVPCARRGRTRRRARWSCPDDCPCRGSRREHAARRCGVGVAPAGEEHEATPELARGDRLREGSRSSRGRPLRRAAPARGPDRQAAAPWPWPGATSTGARSLPSALDIVAHIVGETERLVGAGREQRRCRSSRCSR